MTDITIIHVGDFGERFFADAQSEYAKRLSAYCRFREVCIREERVSDEKSAPLIERALKKEAAAILAALPKGAFVIALCVEGEKMSSERFSAELTRRAAERGGVAFVIGSSHGLAPEVKQASGLRLSFSDMTLPHQLMRVVLAEQIYRAFGIAAGSRYHK